MNLNIRQFPDEVHQRLLARAARQGQSIGECVVQICEKYLQERPDGVVDDSYTVTCPFGHTGPLHRFGLNARCWQCGVGFPLPSEMSE
jgi:hypothetical protein